MKRTPRVFYGYLVLAAIWLIYLFNVSIPLYGTSAINASMTANTDLNESTVGTAVGLVTMMQGITAPLVGFLIKRRGARLPFIIGSSILVFGSIILSFGKISSVSYILVYGLVIGFGTGMGGILATQCIVNEWFVRLRPQALTLAISAGTIGGIIMPQICQAITKTRWTYGWIFTAIVCFVSLLLSIFVVRDKPADIGEIPDGSACSERKDISEISEIECAPIKTHRMVLTPSFFIIMLLCGSQGILYYTYIGHAVLLVVGKGITQQTGIMMISIISFVGLFGRFLAGFGLSRIMSSKTTYMLANIIVAFSILPLALGSSLPWLYLSSALMGLGAALGYVSQPLLFAEWFGKDNFPEVSGIATSMIYILSAIGPLVAGFAASATGSYIPIFTLFALLTFLSALIFLFTPKPNWEQSTLEGKLNNY